MLDDDGRRVIDADQPRSRCYGPAECHDWNDGDGGHGVNRCEHHAGRIVVETSNGAVWFDRAIPDLTDPATIGCLLALVREAHCDPLIYVARNCGIFEVNRGEGEDAARAHGCIYNGPTEAAALVAALKCANGRP
jgi:hypothetical protein